MTAKALPYRYIVIGLIFALLVVMFRLNIFPDVEICQRAKDGRPENCAPYPFIPGIAAYIEAHESLITALATIAIASFTGTLWYSTRTLGVLTKEALIADKRAFVFADGIGQFWELDPATQTYSWQFRPHWRNTADTPTKHMTMYADCELRNSVLPANFGFLDNVANIGKGLIPPKTALHGNQVPRGAPITAQDLVDVQRGKKFIYLWGWIKYSSIISGVDEHVTRFCWLLLPKGDPLKFVPNTPGQPPDVGVLQFDTIQHTEGNCADDECKI